MLIRERNEEGMLCVVAASRGSLLDSSKLALRSARKTLGKERDCSQFICDKEPWPWPFTILLSSNTLSSERADY